MEYNKIVAISGLPGLYELLNSKTDGAIVRSLEDKTTKFVSSRVHNFSHLESIEVFTKRENVNLVDILKAMESSSEKLPDEKDNAALKNYFSKAYPELDFDRVYSSDLKKMVKWFTVLKSNNVELKLSEIPEEEKAEEPVKEEEVKPKEAKETKEPKKKDKEIATEEAPAAKPKKAPSKKAKETDGANEEAAEKPKKAPAKKKSEK